MARKAEPRRQLSLWDSPVEAAGAPTGVAAGGAGQPASTPRDASPRPAYVPWRYPGDPDGTGRDMVKRCQATYPELGGVQCLLRTVGIYCETCAVRWGLQVPSP